MQFVFVLTERLIEMFLINQLKVMTVIWTFRVDTLMNNKVFTVFLMSKSMRAMRAAQGYFVRKLINLDLRFSAAYFAHNLIVRAVVLVKIFFGSFAIRASTVVGNITYRTAFNRLNVITVAPFDVRNKLLIMPNVALDDKRRLIDLKLLILR